MKKKIIAFNDFSFTYRTQVEPTLKKINLSIYEGEKVLIIGPSGSGKSTLGQCLNGIIPKIYTGKSEGEFYLDGKPAFNLSISERTQLISTVLQDTDGQFIGLSVAEDLAFALENDMIAQDKMYTIVKDWASRLNLLELLNYRPQDLSGGQKQRVSLGGVLVDESPVLLFDEPLANLDPKSGQDTIDLIDKLHKEHHTTTIIIEHRLEDVLYRDVDRIVLINEGEILYNGHPNDLLKTNLLQENGIREPLYISVLRELKYPLESSDNLSNLSNLDFSGYQLPKERLKANDIDKIPLLRVSDWNFSYDKNKPILKKLSATFYKGEKVAIVGKNGAGKSTFAKSLCQFLAAEGEICYKNQDISGDSIAERANRIGYVLQNPNQMISQSMIFDEVALGLRLRGIDEAIVKEKTLEILKICGLYSFRHWPISALSYGQKKRVTIASILVLSPEILVLDEPTAGQDQKNYIEIMSFLDGLSKIGHTIIMITHDMQLMLEYADRTLVLSDGQILADDSPIRILSQPHLLEKANLKKTSLFILAEKLDEDPEVVSAYYITERKERL